MHIKELNYHKVLAGEGWAESASHVSAPTLSNCAVPSKTHAHTHEAGQRSCSPCTPSPAYPSSQLSTTHEPLREL